MLSNVIVPGHLNHTGIQESGKVELCNTNVNNQNFVWNSQDALSIFEYESVWLVSRLNKNLYGLLTELIRIQIHRNMFSTIWITETSEWTFSPPLSPVPILCCLWLGHYLLKLITILIFLSLLSREPLSTSMSQPSTHPTCQRLCQYTSLRHCTSTLLPLIHFTSPGPALEVACMHL